MTDSHQLEPDQSADRGPTVDAEVIEDLDTTREDVDEIRGGVCYAAGQRHRHAFHGRDAVTPSRVQ